MNNRQVAHRYDKPAPKVWDINEIRSAMRRGGSHWWDAGSMRFFRCRVLDEVYQGPGGIYFVTSEKGPSENRAYSVRQYLPGKDGGDIDTVGEFNAHTKAGAKRTAYRLSKTPINKQLKQAVAAVCEAMGVPGVDSLDDPRCPVSSKPYSDGSGWCLVTKTDPPENPQCDHDLCCNVNRVLKTEACGPYADIVTASEFVPVSPIDDLILTIERRAKVTVETSMVRALVKQGKEHSRLACEWCNGTLAESNDGDGLPPAIERCRKKIDDLCSAIGVSVFYQGDPRGCTVKLILDDEDRQHVAKHDDIRLTCVPGA